MKAYLKERLYVPISYVDGNASILDSFTYKIDDVACQRCPSKHDNPDACLECPLYETREIRTYSRDKGCIAFCRGNLGKIFKTFRALEIVDQRTDAPFKYDLKFTSKLWDNQIVTTSNWLKYKYGIIESPPRSGKTCMSSFITCSLKQKTLVLTHQQDLLDQFLTTFENHTNLKDLREQFGTKKIVGITNCREDLSDYDVCLCTYQSFITDKGKDFLEDIKNIFGLVIVDECFPAGTQVMVDYDKYMSIEDIVANPEITHVLSYDLERKEIVKKRILNRYKSINTNGWATLEFENEMILTSTPNHNIYTGEHVKVQAKDMKGSTCITYANSKLFKVKYCPECKNLINASDSHHKNICQDLFEICPECGLSFTNLKQHMLLKHDEKGQEFYQKLKNRKGNLNPAYRTLEISENTKTKISKIKKEWFANMSDEEYEWRVKTFMEAPYGGKINRPESQFQKLIPEMIYTGDGNYFVTLTPEISKIPEKCSSCTKKCRLMSHDTSFRKNPDFIEAPNRCKVCRYFDVCIKKDDKVEMCENFKIINSFRTSNVVEIMDFEYWHCREEIQYLKELYAQKGIECLILDAKDIKDETLVKAKVESLLRNHLIKVKDVFMSKKRYGGKPSYKYNIEVEDTHNYFVLAHEKPIQEKHTAFKPKMPILVSNCHLAGAECFRAVVNGLNAKYRLGLSATPERKDKMECLVHDILGPVTAAGQSDEMHCKVIVMNTGVEVHPFRQWTTFIKRLSENERRNKLICETAKRDVDDGRTVLIVTERIKHIDLLADMLTKDGLRVATYDGRVAKFGRKNLLDDIRHGKYEVIIAMRKMIKLGIDIPLLDCYYHIIPMAYDKNYYQEMSRVRTPYPADLELKLGKKKPTPLIRVFLDRGHGAVFACYKIIDKVHNEQEFEIQHTESLFVKKEKKKKLSW